VLGRLVQVFCTVALLVLSTIPLVAQNAVTLSSGTASAGGTATLNLTLTSAAGSEPAGLQWTLAYSPTSIVSIGAIAGANANAAGKSLTCAAHSGSYICLLAGMNNTVIQNGVVAVVSVTIASGVSSATINPLNTLGVTAGGTALPTNGVGGIVTAVGISPPTPSTLGCAPASLSAGGSASCTVTVSNTGGAFVALSDDSASLTVPASVTVTPGSTTATFTATAGAIASNQTAVVTATSGGSSVTTSISLVASTSAIQIPVFNTGVAFAAVLLADATVDRHYKLVASADPAFPGPDAVTVNSNANPFPNWTANGPNSKWIGPRADAGAGNSEGTYTYRTTFDLTGFNAATAVLTGQWASDNEGVMKLNGATVSTGSASSFFGWTPFIINTLNAGLVGGINTLDFVITNDPPGNNPTNPTGLRVEISGTALPALSGVLTSASRSPSNGAESTSAIIPGIRPTSVTCSPGTIQAGDFSTCTVRLSALNIPEIAHLAVRSDSPNLKSPTSLTTRPGQTQLDFKVYSDPFAKQQTSAVTVQFGQTSVSDTVVVTRASAPILRLPAPQLTKAGKQVAFTVSAIDPDGLPLTLSVGALPAGAFFDPGTRSFSWTAKEGTYHFQFTATNSRNVSSTGDLLMQVDSGEPVITDIRNAASQVSQHACSPGAVASLVGRWLAAGDQPVSDPSGASTQLAGARVKINGVDAPVLYASARRIDFQCPGVEPGAALEISTETEAGVANTVAATMQYSAPGVYSLDGSGRGQGLVTVADGSALAASRSYQTTGQPAEPGDSISLLATGIGSLQSAAFLQVRIADSYAVPDSVQAVPGMAGVYQVKVRVPGSAPAGDAIPVVLQTSGPDGATFQGNTITIAIEPAR
jgi:uncharacterized protein (TIGR03437 family)